MSKKEIKRDFIGINTDYRELIYTLTDLIEDLGSEEMKRQMYEILKKSSILDVVDETDSMLTGEEVCDTLNKQDKQIQEFISYFESQNKEKKELEFKLHTLRKWYTCRDCAFSEKELKYLRSLDDTK